MLQNAIIRSLPQALYQPLNIGHFGLALAEYAHFTSPIRRYPDLLVHRGIRHALAGGTAADFEHSPREMEVLGQECSMRERRADEAARSVVALLKCEFMRPKIGEEFDSVATGVAEFGVFVQLKGIQVDGLVHVTSLPRDYFRFHEGDRTLVGERTGMRLLDRRRTARAPGQGGFSRAQDRLRARGQDGRPFPSASPQQGTIPAQAMSDIAIVYGPARGARTV